MLRVALIYLGAAVLEIAGCFSFWLWLRQGLSSWLVLVGVISLAGFAWLLTLVETAAAGRAYAAYGGIYIMAALTWMFAVEGVRPDRWDLIGTGVCLIGAALILLGPRGA